jgi:hypothetical protein
MIKDEKYYFHQTPNDLAKELIKFIPFEDNDIVLEAFRGEGAFYNNLPSNIIKEWCEITEGKCYTSFDKPFDWIVSNPPFRLESGNKKVNSFYYLLNYYSKRANKGIAFLGNYNCFNTLTPKRMKEINELGFYLNKVIVCNIKKWSNRYYFLIFTKNKNNIFEYLDGSY